MESPLVSIIIPAYNQGIYLRQAVESVVQQDYAPLEIIIINDGSTDTTSEVGATLQAEFTQIQFITQNNQGVCHASATGLERAKGEFVIRLDADDYIPSDYVSKLMQCMHEQPAEVAYIYCDAEYVGVRSGRMAAAPYSLGRLVTENYIHVSALVRKEVIKKVGYYNSNMVNSFEDWDLYLSLAEAGFRGEYCPDTFLYYRQKVEKGRNDMSAQQWRNMRQQIQANHPKLYSKPVNQLRVFAWRLNRKVRSL